MRKRTKWIVVGIVLTIGVLGAAASVLTNGMRESRIYVLETLPAICKTWDEGTLRKHLSREKFSDADVHRIATVAPKELGAITSFAVHRGTISSTQINGKTQMRFCYAVPASFEKSKNSGVMFYVAHVEGRWQLVDFDVSNPHEQRNNLFKPAPASAFLPLPKGHK
jgi:hypothetical protein